MGVRPNWWPVKRDGIITTIERIIENRKYVKRRVGKSSGKTFGNCKSKVHWFQASVKNSYFRKRKCQRSETFRIYTQQIVFGGEALNLTLSDDGISLPFGRETPHTIIR